MTAPPAEERRLTAQHEAGHAVAALLRGGGDLVSVTIEPTAKYAGHTGFRSKVFDSAFITYAGPWAEARCQWPDGLDLESEDDDGLTFDDYVMGAWLRNPDDWADYEAACAADVTAFGYPADLLHFRETAWCRELEGGPWPVIQQIAELLMRGPVAADEIRATMMSALL
ncbi:hypothetical protein [Mycolicibacterium sphagni]|uniref:hypothetical protein n=1 Tax=Mycolicibacterium sphagni TaxID=1786 RepID=UPI0021F34221|nr:hypothetical protein [Mycolicibacterium sphagni]MCV7176136.1 hypothetical protein [Mycolicibacterium sphagni]